MTAALTSSEQQDAGMVAGATTCDKRLPTDLRLAFTNHKLRYEPEVALGRSETWLAGRKYGW